MAHPYANLPEHQFWRRGVSHVEPHLLDPVVKPRFSVTKATKIATAGSCFAQHIARTLVNMGLTYYVPEAGDDLAGAERERLQYGLFSARYGNIYTVEQLFQLMGEAFDGRRPKQTAWQRPDGRYVDPYRPNVEPDGFDDPGAVCTARDAHLRHVRSVFLGADVFVFTMGLTEAWRSKQDGAVFPLAPGVIAGAYEPHLHEFHNFSVGEVTDTLCLFLERLKGLNNIVNVLLTVSPVPLIATYEDRHVLVSTTYSKSVLRVAAQAAVDRFDWVDYFPSFEIITGSPTGGLYFEPDHRDVTPRGVQHAMRIFAERYMDGHKARRSAAGPTQEEVLRHATREVICEEEALDQAP